MNKGRNEFTSKLKAMVAMEALKEQQTLAELSNRFEAHPNQITAWKRGFIENADAAFGSEKQHNESGSEVPVEKLFQQIGQLQVENDFFKKSLKKAGLWKS